MVSSRACGVPLRCRTLASMAFFYFDESIHTTAGFIVGAWVAWQQDPTERINDALRAAGLRPGVDEFKSGARMSGNESMARAREGLKETLRDCRIGVVVVPSVQEARHWRGGDTGPSENSLNDGSRRLWTQSVSRPGSD